MIAGVIFDLDDTLFDQRQWLSGAWRAVAIRAASDGVDQRQFEQALHDVAAEGSDRGRIIDRALAAVGAADVPSAPLVAAFRAHTPNRLDPYPGVADALRRLRVQVQLAVITDGVPSIQRAKVDALGLGDVFAAVVVSDEHGRSHRKPDALPFLLALDTLGIDASAAVYIGDRPRKDIAGAVGIGMRAVRVRTGEWRDEPDDPRAWASVDTVVEAIEVIEPELQGPRSNIADAAGAG